MALFGLTTNYNFKLIDFDVATWHDDEYDNWREVDALLFNFIQLANVVGVWANSTAYTIGQRVVDGTDSTIWEVQVAHTSAASPVLFAADRTANPTYWTQIGAAALNEEAKRFAREARTSAGVALSQVAETRNNVALTAADVVSVNTVLVQVRSQFRSMGAYLSQIVGWAYAAETSKTAAAASEVEARGSEHRAAGFVSLALTQMRRATAQAIIATAQAVAAAASAAAASTSETNAATSEANAATSEANASTSETNAATSETNAAMSASAAAASAASINQGNTILQSQVFS